MDLRELLLAALRHSASDLHLSAGLPPRIRVDGELQPLSVSALQQDDIQEMLWEIMSDRHRHDFKTRGDTDFSYEQEGIARFRVTLFHQLRGVGAVFRIIPATIPSWSDLGLPALVKGVLNYSQGLVLVSGATGSGKSTTLAALIDCINKTRASHIITLEDPIEFVHQSLQSVVTQREVYRDTPSFDVGLRAALRADPDIILVGELRCLETIRMALTAAETGHLVFATLHTHSATAAINRIIDVFPGDEKAVVRTLLAESLQAVVAQVLVKKRGGGRLPAVEVMHCTPAIRNLIREGKVAQIISSIQTGHAQGMQTLDQHLTQLVNTQVIERCVAQGVADKKSDLNLYCAPKLHFDRAQYTTRDY